MTEWELCKTQSRGEYVVVVPGYSFWCEARKDLALVNEFTDSVVVSFWGGNNLPNSLEELL